MVLCFYALPFTLYDVAEDAKKQNVDSGDSLYSLT